MRLGFSPSNDAKWNKPEIYDRLICPTYRATLLGKIKYAVKRIFHFFRYGIYVTNHGALNALDHHKGKISQSEASRRIRLLRQCFTNQETLKRINALAHSLLPRESTSEASAISVPPTTSTPPQNAPLSGITIHKHIGGKVLKIQVSEQALQQHGLAKIVQNYPDLTKISLCNTSATDRDLALLAPLSSLSSLDLEECSSVTDNGLANLSPLTSLAKLNVRGCSGITEKGLFHLSQNHALTLTSLCLESCDNISEKGFEYLSNLFLLSSLSLQDCHWVNDHNLSHLMNLPALSHLDLSWCSITDKGLKVLRRMHSLSTLDLCACDVTDRGRLKLSSAISGLQIIG